MKLLVHWIVNSLAIMVAAYVVPGVYVQSFLVAMIAALVLGLINLTLKPILLILTLPINILTLGLFTFVVNAVLILLVAAIVNGFQVADFTTALIFGIVLSIVLFISHLVFS